MKGKRSIHNEVRFDDSSISNKAVMSLGGLSSRSMKNLGGASDDRTFKSTSRTSNDLDFRFKVILLGDSKVGKSSIVRRLVDQSFNLKYDETTYFDTVNKRLVVND